MENELKEKVNEIMSIATPEFISSLSDDDKEEILDLLDEVLDVIASNLDS